MSPPDERDRRSRPMPNVPRPSIDDDSTPVEGTPSAFSLHTQLGQLRADFRLHSDLDAQGLRDIREKQDEQAADITAIKVETGRQTVMLENIRDEVRSKEEERKRKAAKEEETAKEELKARREKIWGVAKWVLAIVGSLITGYLSHYV